MFNIAEMEKLDWRKTVAYVVEDGFMYRDNRFGGGAVEANYAKIGDFTIFVSGHHLTVYADSYGDVPYRYSRVTTEARKLSAAVAEQMSQKIRDLDSVLNRLLGESKA